MELLPFGQISGPLKNKCELKQALLDDQIAPGDQIGRPDFHILVMSKIWSPIRSPERLVVNLVVVDAVTGFRNAGRGRFPQTGKASTFRANDILS